MDMPTVTAEHRQLEKLVGSWSGQEQLAPSPWDPAGGSAEGAVTNRTAIDGFAVVQDYEQRRNGQVTFRGHGVFQYNPQAGQYIMHWWDSMGMGVNEFRGQFENGVLSLVGPSTNGQARCRFDVSQPGRYTFTMDVSPDGENWMNFMSGNYASCAAPSATASAKKPAPRKAAAKAAKPKKKSKPKPMAMAKKKTAAKKGGAKKKAKKK